MLSVRSVSGVAIAMSVNRIEDIVESAHWCLLLIMFVGCHGRCNNCSVDFLRSRRSVVGGC